MACHNDLLPRNDRFYSGAWQNLALFSGGYKTLAGSVILTPSPAPGDDTRSVTSVSRRRNCLTPKAALSGTAGGTAASGQVFEICSTLPMPCEVVTDPTDLAGLPPDVIEVACGSAAGKPASRLAIPLHAPHSAR